MRMKTKGLIEDIKEIIGSQTRARIIRQWFW